MDHWLVRCPIQRVSFTGAWRFISIGRPIFHNLPCLACSSNKLPPLYLNVRELDSPPLPLSLPRLRCLPLMVAPQGSMRPS